MLKNFIRLDRRATTIFMMTSGVLITFSTIMALIAPCDAWEVLNRSAIGIGLSTMVLGSLK